MQPETTLERFRMHWQRSAPSTRLCGASDTADTRVPIGTRGAGEADRRERRGGLAIRLQGSLTSRVSGWMRQATLPNGSLCFPVARRSAPSS